MPLLKCRTRTTSNPVRVRGLREPADPRVVAEMEFPILEIGFEDPTSPIRGGYFLLGTKTRNSHRT